LDRKWNAKVISSNIIEKNISDGQIKLFIFPALDQNITYLELTVAAAIDNDDLDEQR